MACSECRRRSELLATLAPAIERIRPLTRQSLLSLLALDEQAICRAAKIKDPGRLIRQIEARIADGARGAPTTHPTTARGAPTTRGARDSPRASSAVCHHDTAYPTALAQLESAPAVVHATCETERLRELLDAPTVAIVGSREHTGYAHQVTFALAHDLARAGVTIISGLHQGIDGIAQHGAMHADGSSIAVTGCAPERPYPRQLEHLHRRIRERGAIASELGPGHYPPRRWSLIASQRLIAGIADIVVVVEARESSSAMLTVQVAADLGHDVAAVPGRITDKGARGTFALIRDGAHPVGCAEDVLELLHESSRPHLLAEPGRR
jgi:DNA protecting protein DprA